VSFPHSASVLVVKTTKEKSSLCNDFCLTYKTLEMPHKLIFFLVAHCLALVACSQNAAKQDPLPELIFQSGFEPGSKVISKGNDADITGKDLSVPSPNDWT